MRRPNSVSRVALVLALFCRYLGLNAAFSPRDRAELKTAVDEWIENSTAARAIYGEIGGWDVSQVTSMNRLFYTAATFNDDISGWNVSSVTDMAF
eukprot:608470-Amphidinium_carterae.1